MPSETTEREFLATGEAQFVREARFYEKLADGRVKCRVCPRGCVVAEGSRGDCGVRENRGGMLRTLVYARACAAHADPIEKKPLFHFLPGTLAFSIATAGCNVHCAFCQNWEIAQSRPEEIPAEFVPPERVVEAARATGCASIAFTYTEPTVFAEYAIDVAEAGRAAGLRSVAISNGFVAGEAREALYGAMDAVKIDLKAFSERFYREQVHAQLRPVLDSLVALRAMGKWVEIVSLLVPTLNDGEEELRAMAAWIKANLGGDVPLHFSRFHPAYRLNDLPTTPLATLERAKAIAEAEGLRYVYLGNVAGHEAENTYCPACKKLLVERRGFSADARQIDAQGACAFCGAAIAGVWHA
jgi:pyruvate formate lyase activating enzyme